MGKRDAVILRHERLDVRGEGRGGIGPDHDHELPAGIDLILERPCQARELGERGATGIDEQREVGAGGGEGCCRTGELGLETRT